MNILMHCIYFPPEVGGLESHVFNLCRGLAARGHRVDVVTSRSRPDLPREELMGDVHVLRTWLPARNPGGWLLHSMCSTPRTTWASARVDVVHAQAIASIPPAWIAGRIRGRPLVSTLHTSHFLRLARKAQWRPEMRTLLRKSDRYLRHQRRDRRCRRRPAPGSVHGAGDQRRGHIGLSALRAVASAGARASAGRAAPSVSQERSAVFRAGDARNRRESPILRQMLVGDGPEREELESLERATRRGRTGSVSSATRPNAEMPGILSSATVAVLPSLMEATSIAALEAMACELPVAASRVGGLPEIVDESVGTLFESGDPADLARRLVALLRRPDLRQIGRRARGRVAARWSNDRLVERHLEVYEALGAGKRAPHA